MGKSVKHVVAHCEAQSKAQIIQSGAALILSLFTVPNIEALLLL